MKFGLMGVFNFGCFVMGLLQIFKEKRKVCKKQLKMQPREMTWVLQRCSLFFFFPSSNHFVLSLRFLLTVSQFCALFSLIGFNDCLVYEMLLLYTGL